LYKKAAQMSGFFLYFRLNTKSCLFYERGS
jgi:hypothetical protein